MRIYVKPLYIFTWEQHKTNLKINKEKCLKFFEEGMKRGFYAVFYDFQHDFEIEKKIKQ